jgi:plastocyanin
MNKNYLVTFILSFFITIFISSCATEGMSEPVGGELPTNYIIVKDSSFSPALLSIASGSSVTFVNNTAIVHTIISDDSTTIGRVVIEPGTSFYFKKDTTATIGYHCMLHPTARGIIDFRP